MTMTPFDNATDAETEAFNEFARDHQVMRTFARVLFTRCGRPDYAMAAAESLAGELWRFLTEDVDLDDSELSALDGRIERAVRDVVALGVPMHKLIGPPGASPVVSFLAYCAALSVGEDEEIAAARPAHPAEPESHTGRSAL